METGAWHDATLARVRRLLQPDEDVLALAVFGSALGPEVDAWSDLDLLVVVKEDALRRFYPAVDWLRPLGSLYALEQSSQPHASVTRACFADFRRLDWVITTEEALARIAAWPRVPFWSGARTLFSRSSLVARVLAQPFPHPQPTFPSVEQFEELANRFWFKATVATSKVVRRDLLIALHLALDLQRDCCVLAMLLRDRAEGTNVRRAGESGNRFLVQLGEGAPSYTSAGILDLIEQSAVVFDELAGELSADYRERRQPLLGAVSQARQASLDR